MGIEKEGVLTGRCGGRNYSFASQVALPPSHGSECVLFCELVITSEALFVQAARDYSPYSATGDNYCFIKCAERFAAGKALEVQMLF